MSNKIFLLSLIFILILSLSFNCFALDNIQDIQLDFINVSNTTNTNFSESVFSDLGVISLYDYLHSNNLTDDVISSLQYCVVRKSDSVSYYNVFLSATPFYVNNGNLYNSYGYGFSIRSDKTFTSLSNDQGNLNNPIQNRYTIWLVSSPIYSDNTYTTEIDDYGYIIKDNQFFNNSIDYNTGSEEDSGGIGGIIDRFDYVYDILSNTSSYDNSVAHIDTSFNDIQDVNGVDNFLSTLYQTLYEYFYNLDFSNSISVDFPVPFTNKTFSISTEPVQQFYNDNQVLAALITMFWYFTFGIFVFRLAYTFWVSSVTGAVFRDTEGFTASIDEGNLIKNFFL